jgi:hypothetical protein
MAMKCDPNFDMKKARDGKAREGVLRKGAGLFMLCVHTGRIHVHV